MPTETVKGVIAFVGISILGLGALAFNGQQQVVFDERQFDYLMPDKYYRHMFDRIEPGMSYSQVQLIIGSAGELLSQSHIDGVPGVMEPVDTVMYQWANNNGSSMNATFQNDRLLQKSQFGLK